MSRIDADDWIPVEMGSDVLNRVLQTSAVEAVGRHENMRAAVYDVPRYGAATTYVLNKGDEYVDDTTLLDNVRLEARKFTNALVVAEEDLEDANADILSTHMLSAATSYAIHFDSAALGTTAVANGKTVPFTSVYKSVASGNKLASNAVTYTNLSDTLALVEGGQYWSDADTVIVAHPKFKSVLRGIVDSNGRPIFVEGLAGTPSTLFGYNVAFSFGAITSATASATPGGAGGTTAGAAGNPLLIAGNRQHLIVGDRTPLEWRLDESVNARTDEPFLRMRARKGFAVGRPEAFGILEVTKSA
ncbi:phage major capsid protein [Streptomyces parvulus]|uniref:phage major capsid protein n=1 Tax=Streptomyces parvulus TaxID=146923 RepID=UPI0036B0BCB5